MDEKKRIIVVDANPLLSALLGGKARAIILSGLFRFVTTEHTTWEVKKYIPSISEKSAVPEKDIFFAFDRFPILTFHQKDYIDVMQKSASLIGDRDRKDVDVLALALKLGQPIWSDDKDFEKLM